ITIDSYPWRDPSSFGTAAQKILREAFYSELAWGATDAALSVCWQQCSIDAYWLHGILEQHRLAARDAFWCGYLHKRYEELGPVRRLIDAGFELAIDAIDVETATRWAIALLWFTA